MGPRKGDRTRETFAQSEPGIEKVVLREGPACEGKRFPCAFQMPRILADRREHSG